MKAEIHLDITLRDDNGEIIAHDTMNRIEPTTPSNDNYWRVRNTFIQMGISER